MLTRFCIIWSSWETLNSVKDLLACWRGNHFSYVWNAIPLCLLWFIWKEWNRKLEWVETSLLHLRLLFLRSLFKWLRVYWDLVCNSCRLLFIFHFRFLLLQNVLGLLSWLVSYTHTWSVLNPWPHPPPWCHLNYDFTLFIFSIIFLLLTKKWFTLFTT